MLDVLIQGGSSGSPVFDPDSGEVVGVIYGGLFEERAMAGEGLLVYRNPTSHTFAVPANQIQNALRAVAANKALPSNEDARALSDIIASATLVAHMPKMESPLVRKIGPE
jgi:S1-C subfamily serine protease